MNPSQRAPCRLSHALSLGARPLNWAGSRPDPHISPKPDHDDGAAGTGSRLRGSRYRNMADLGFAHQLLICPAAITLAEVLTTPRRYDRVDACSAHVASEHLLRVRHTQ